MKQVLKRLLFGTQPAQQYLTLSLKPSDIREKVFLRSGRVLTDVSQCQFVVCQNPFVIAIWMGASIDDAETGFQIEIVDGTGRMMVEASLLKLKVIDLDGGSIVLFQLIRTKYQFISAVHQKALITYFYLTSKSKVSFYELNGFCASYLYPRKVVLTCFGGLDSYNVFPMDLCGHIPETGFYILGLRNTNVTLTDILAARKVVVCEVPASEKDTILSLGRHHSARPPAPESLPFSLKETPAFRMCVPDIATSFWEIEVIQFCDMGSHTVMIGKILNTVGDVPAQINHLFHLHISYAVKNILPYQTI